MKLRYPVIAIVLIVICILAAVVTQLQKMARIADIISDEAEWDVLDSLAASRTKAVVLQDGSMAGFSGEEESCSHCCIRDTFTVSKNADSDYVIQSGDEVR